MSKPLIYVDSSDVREGALEELKSAIEELTDFVESHEPRIVSYAVYFSDDGGQMTVVHVHADSDSLDHHMDVAGPRFGRFADLVTLSSIHIFGEPSAKAMRQLEDKVRLLGTGEVTVHAPHTGFGRFGAGERPLGSQGRGRGLMASTNLDLVRSLQAAWERGDYRSTEWADPEIEFVMEGEYFPDPGTYRGVEAMVRAWTRWLSAWEGFHTSGAELIDLGDRVVALYSIHGRGKSSGVEVEAPVANVFTFHSGKVVRLDLLTREQGLKEAGVEE